MCNRNGTITENVCVAPKHNSLLEIIILLTSINYTYCMESDNPLLSVSEGTSPHIVLLVQQKLRPKFTTESVI